MRKPRRSGDWALQHKLGGFELASLCRKAAAVVCAFGRMVWLGGNNDSKAPPVVPHHPPCTELV
jgi:hypothetical protein